jgi:hypothetical protein
MSGAARRRDDLPGAGDPPDDPVDEPGRHRGRRRAGRLSARGWMVTIALLAVVGTALAVPFALRSSPPGPHDGTATGTGNAAAPAQTATEALSTASPGESGGPLASGSPSLKPNPLTYGPVSYEAEAASNVLGGAASVAPYPASSGGSVVQNIGYWGPGAKRHGTLTFPNVAVPADGTYTLTVYAVGPDDGSPLTAVITLSSGAKVTVTVAGGPACCTTKAVRVSLTKGLNTVTFGSPEARAPSIDKIVIGMP